jgi:hypothetical protein
MTGTRQFFSNYRVAILAWILIIILVCAGLYYSVDKSALALAVLLVGVLGHAFAALVTWIGFVPFVGPLIAHLLSLPFLWLINGAGYVTSIIAIKRGYC